MLSIYEIPSQLAISASSFMSLGQYASGSAWQNVTIDGGIFAGKAEVDGDTAINALASRRGMTLSSGTTIGGQSFTNSPSLPASVRPIRSPTERFSLCHSLPKAAGPPLFRSTVARSFSIVSPTPRNPMSCLTTTWNNYSIGAFQCAMRLDITRVQSATNPTPTMLRFQYYLPPARGRR